jgi:tetratricopeptide (TPR) repeat protein
MFDVRAKIFLCRLQLLTLMIFSGAASVQSQPKEAKNLFAQAESFYLYGEYELANPLYLSLASFVPDNNNIIYKIGNCYLNIPDEKSKAIEYLEKAVKSASADAKPTQLKENRAPLDAYFSLARAYMINNELEKAMNTFKVFQKMINESKDKVGFQNTDFIDQQMLACQNAIKFLENPTAVDTMRLPPEFSQGSVNDAPAMPILNGVESQMQFIMQRKKTASGFLPLKLLMRSTPVKIVQHVHLTRMEQNYFFIRRIWKMVIYTLHLSVMTNGAR